MIKPSGLCENEHGDWVRYADVINDPSHIPSMQINELCRKLSGLEEAIERGHVEAGKRVWALMCKQCYWYRGGTCKRNDYNKCEYGNCPIMEKCK